MDPLNIDFLPAEARAFWSEQFAADPAALDQLVAEERAKAQSLAGVWETSFLEELYASAQDAIAQGDTVATWIETADAILSRYTPEGVDVLVDPSGERGDEFSSWYGDLVFRSQASNAYSAGRYAQMFSPDGQAAAEYWLYSSLHDERTRPEHAALDGFVFSKDDPEARKILPPWDYNCRCLASDIDADQVEEGEYDVTRASDLNIEGGFGSDQVRALVPGPVRQLLS